MAGLIAPQHQSADAARAFLEKIRWPDGPVCPHCGVIGDATKLEMKEAPAPKEGQKAKAYTTHARKGVYKCRACEKQFTVTVGTIFEDSHIPLHKWLLAIHLMGSSKKGISAHQLMRSLELGSYRTAWSMAHRVRWAMGQEPMTKLLSGIVEIDEVWVGGKEKGPHAKEPESLKPAAEIIGPNRTRVKSKKTPAVVFLERGGNVHSARWIG